MNDLVRLLLGRNQFSARIVVVTPRGVEIPIGRAEGWTVADFTRLLGEIDQWPETPERDGWSRRVA